MLRNPYYIGTVVYMGNANRNGRQPKLIDPETFERVQARLTAQRAAGDRPRRHQHYLKGSLTCDLCGSKLLYGLHRGHGGQYEYFSCTKRRARNGGHCPSGHYAVERVEIEVAALYWNLKLTPAQIAKSREKIMAQAEQHADVIRRSADRHRRRLAALETEQTKLLQLHYKGGVAESVMQRETERIETEHQTLAGLLSRAKIQLDEIRGTLDIALGLTERPLESYLASSNLGRRLLNQVFFSQIRVGPSGEITEATLTPFYVRIIAPKIIRRDDPDEAHEPTLPGRKRTNPDPFFIGDEV